MAISLGILTQHFQVQTHFRNRIREVQAFRGPPGAASPLRDQRLHWTRGRVDPDPTSSQFVWPWEEIGISSKEIAKEIAMAIYLGKLQYNLGKLQPKRNPIDHMGR